MLSADYVFFMEVLDYTEELRKTIEEKKQHAKMFFGLCNDNICCGM